MFSIQELNSPSVEARDKQTEANVMREMDLLSILRRLENRKNRNRLSTISDNQ